MIEANAMDDLRQKVSQMEKDIKKSLNFNMDKLSNIVKDLEFKRQKKTKMNKMPATIMQANDGSIKIVFDDIKDSDKFYGQ